MKPPLRLGPLVIDPPVVLAPMAGVTNAPFRTMCSRAARRRTADAAPLLVNEMVTARALIESNEKTEHLASFGEGEAIRSIQLYGVDPRTLAEATRLLVDEGRIDHLDLNFGCPVPKVTRHGGGAALPVRSRLLARILDAVVAAAGGIPVTAKFRMGVDDDHLTFLQTGRIAEESGCSAVSLHARTAEQLYSGTARWAAIGELKAAVGIPVLGNGDIWEATDALEMLSMTGCDGVVVGRGALGRPWLFGDLTAVLRGGEASPPPLLGEVSAMMIEHLRLLVDWHAGSRWTVRRSRTVDPMLRAATEFRKHTGWYVKGYGVGGAVRAQMAEIRSIEDLAALVADLDATTELTMQGRRAKRGHQQGPRTVSLPEGWYDLAESDDALDADAELATSGG